mmetsp:Transcript_50530/g.156745  ORF Transcript_50530/g.156745 Transcript_50530/m.156745 type:complete len:331 (-) Transcript_50530:62-1054(-)
MAVGGMCSPWASFNNCTDDGVLLSILRHVSIFDVLQLLGTSASTLVQLDGAPCRLEGHALPGAPEHRTIVRELLSGVLGEAVTFAVTAAATACQDCENSELEEDPEMRRLACRRRPCASSHRLAALRALAGARPAAAALRLALGLSRRASGLGAERMASVACKWDAGPFLDALFRAETARRRGLACSPRPGAATAAAARAAVAALVTSAEGGRLVVLASAAALREAERSLDDLYENCSAPHGYECVARRRSAAEFLREDLAATAASVGGEALAEALQELGSAAKSLDETIRGCCEEGFELTCHRLEHGAPHSHWWLFLSDCEQGKYGYCF